LAKISRRVLKYRERQRRGAVMRPSTFAAIERRAAAGGAYDPAAVAGAAYWKTLAAKYRGNPFGVETVLYGIPKGKTERYEEVLLLTNATPESIERVKILARKDGFHSFRVAKIDLSVPPDFSKAVKRNPRGRTVPEILRECDEMRAALRHRMRPGENPDASVERISDRSAKVVTAKGHVDYPIRYDDGRIAYDFPERVPAYLKKKVAKLLSKPRGENPFDWREQRTETGTILDAIRHGDKVTILSPQGQERTGKAVMRSSSGGWVLNMGGRHGTPGIATESNIVKVRKANPSRGVFVFFDDSIGKYTAVTYHPRFGNLFMTGKTEAAARRALRARVAQAERTGTHRNPDDELPEAERLYETFHGREPREILELTDSAVERGEYVNLGDLVELTIVAPDKNHVKVGFKDDGVRLASTAEGTQLVLIGGNQDISRTLGMFGAEDTSKDLLDLGDLKQIVYDAAKWQTDFTPQEWKHDLGEESGIRPRVLFNQLKKRIFFAGGTYRVERPGIVD